MNLGCPVIRCLVRSWLMAADRPASHTFPTDRPLLAVHRAAGLGGSREWRVGTVISSCDPVLAEQIGASFDLAWIDLEHSALSVRDAQTLALAVQAAGAECYVRLPRSDSELLGAVLDTAVDGIVAPKVESQAQADRLAAALRYPPHGSRGFAPRRAAGGRQRSSSPNEDAPPKCVVQIETREGLRNAEAIAAVEGISALVVGTSDLSFELGVPLDPSSPTLVAATLAVGEAASAHGKAWGVAIASTPDWTSELRAKGAAFLVFASDLRVYGAAVEDAAARARAVGTQAMS